MLGSNASVIFFGIPHCPGSEIEYEISKSVDGKLLKMMTFKLTYMITIISDF